jgi:SpoVK/Ycf46/Vps4 family AAA+-type ATPase
MMGMRNKIRGLRADEIKNLKQGMIHHYVSIVSSFVIFAEEMDIPVSTKDFEIALSKISPSVSKDDIKKYEEWSTVFGST